MKVEQLMTLMYSFLGIVCGFVSQYFKTLMFSLTIPVLAYVASVIIMSKFVKSRRMKWLISNSFVTFVLIWLLTWVFLYNVK